MKKIFILLFAVMLTATANAQFKFGVKGGVNVTQLSLDVDKYKFNNHNNAGFFIGPMVKFTVPVVGLGVDAAVLYSQSQFKTDVENASTVVDGQTITVENNTVKQQYISIPINVRYTIGLGSTANLFLFTGPQFNFNVGDKTVTYIVNVAEWKNNSSQFSWNFGVGATVFSHLQVSVNYNLACSKNTNLSGTLTDVIGNVSAKTNLWQVGIGWWF